MTVKQKAEELLWKYAAVIPDYPDYVDWEEKEIAKKCAILSVEQLLNCANKHDGYVVCDKDYWKQVKEEIEKL